MSISVSSLEKSVEVLARKLHKQGYDCEVFTFKNEGVTSLGSSYVELTVERGEVWLQICFLANGYVAVHSYEIGDWGMKWSEMKTKFLALLEKDEELMR